MQSEKVLKQILAVGALAVCPLAAPAAQMPNIVFLTLDDMDQDSVGVYGCPIPDITPHIDRLATQGMRFDHAHVPTAVCAPARQSLMTAQFAHRNGTFGFIPLPEEAATLGKMLKDRGYFTGSIGKGRDYSPVAAHGWDYFAHWAQGFNRNPEHLAHLAEKVIDRAKAAGQPFFLNLNSSDPHRPFVGSDEEDEFQRRMEKYDPTWVDNNELGEVNPKLEDYFIQFGWERMFEPDDVPVPGYLPDLPEIRLEMAEYFTSVKRGDAAVGRILELLERKGVEGETLLFFFSDHGASLPTSKSDTFPHSTRVPFIVRWPVRVAPGSVNADALVSVMDIMPTLAEILGMPSAPDWDGRSMLPLLEGKEQDGRDWLMTTYNYRSPGEQVFPTRAITSAAWHYMFQPWAGDLRQKPRTESHAGRTYEAIQSAAAGSNAEAKDFLDRYHSRNREVLYDLRTDPFCKVNLADHPEYSAILEEMRTRLQTAMTKSEDPLLPVFLGEKPSAAVFPYRRPKAGE